MTHGNWIDLASEFKALCVLVEHRYYGKSHPTPLVFELVNSGLVGTEI